MPLSWVPKDPPQSRGCADDLGITFVAFTATPKSKMLEIFGTQPDPSRKPSAGSIHREYPRRKLWLAGSCHIRSAENQANFRTTVYSVTQSGYDSNQNYLTDGGTYGGSGSFYGTFDQGGNVWEWNEAVIIGSFRGLRGGSWGGSESNLRSSSRNFTNPDFEIDFIGFCVASP
ncbi:MAG: SUMF1/EgtB/PvdO family nonheme iron enzyme [Verrucomicrobiales bacterium]|nr:SUMF1/EgtB/PvdO family nonheme iron enzyme [Verrucomicrobiales bacterium]